MEILEPLATAYAVCAVVTWRILAGMVAWKIHTTAKFQRSYKPEVEDWVCAAIVTVPLAAVWWFFLLFRSVPKKWLSVDEQTAIKFSEIIKMGEEQRLEIERHKMLDKLLEPGDHHG